MINLPSESNGQSSETALQKALSTMDAQALLTLISELIAAGNMITITSSGISVVPRQTNDYERAYGRKDIFFCRGYTGWE